MNVQRGSKRSGARRHDQRVQNDLPDHQTECVQQGLMLPIDMARTKALMVPRVLAIKNGGLLSSSNGVFDMIPNSNAGSET